VRLARFIKGKPAREQLTADFLNAWADGIERGTPLDSPDIKWERTAMGSIGRVNRMILASAPPPALSVVQKSGTTVGVTPGLVYVGGAVAAAGQAIPSIAGVRLDQVPAPVLTAGAAAGVYLQILLTGSEEDGVSLSAVNVVLGPYNNPPTDASDIIGYLALGYFNWANGAITGLTNLGVGNLSIGVCGTQFIPDFNE
jgi:hypothetical protein